MTPRLNTEPFCLSSLADVYQIAILHRGRWHETKVDCGYDRVVFLADDASRRSGLRVQVRGEDGSILYEAGAKPGCAKVCVG